MSGEGISHLTATTTLRDKTVGLDLSLGTSRSNPNANAIFFCWRERDWYWDWDGEHVLDIEIENEHVGLQKVLANNNQSFFIYAQLNQLVLSICWRFFSSLFFSNGYLVCSSSHLGHGKNRPLVLSFYFSPCLPSLIPSFLGWTTNILLDFFFFF